MKGKYLITTDAFFIAPDGQEYRSVWGEVEILQDSFLGIKTNARSSNWYVMIGSEENYVIIAGCQIHYAVRTKNRPSSDECVGWDDKGQRFKTPSKIYFAE